MLSAFSFRRFTDDDDAATAAGAPHADEHLTYDVVRFKRRCDSLMGLANNDDVPQEDSGDFQPSSSDAVQRRLI